MTDYETNEIENDAETLYGLIHARFILTNRGFQCMAERYKAGYFGTCPRVHCHASNMIPCGISDVLDTATVKLFCPTCSEVYEPKGSRCIDLDGAYFGTTFPHLFFMQYPELKRPLPKESYVPRIFGFRVNANSHQKCLERKEIEEKNKQKTEK